MPVPEVVRHIASSFTITHAICLAGTVVLARWLIHTSLGRRSLDGSIPRRNSMAPYTPFIPFFIWLTGTLVLQGIVDFFTGPLQGWQETLSQNVTFSVGEILATALILVMAHFHFARGLKGFGLNPRTIGRDLGAAFVNLLAIWPLVLAAMIVTTAIGQTFWGQDFEMRQHQQLQVIAESPSLALQILVIFLAVVVVPILEETLFRGMLQTMIRTYVDRPWPAIVITSMLFAMVHANGEHWPALFVLALGLGYSYEKSNSLLRPIFIHALFNGSTILAALLE